MRYLEWNWDPDPTDTTFTADFAFLLHEADGSLRVVPDRHLLGLFPRDLWLRLLGEVGFQPRALPFEHAELEPATTDLFVGVRPVE